MTATQRPMAEAAFSEPIGAPAWRRLPAWTVLATADKGQEPDVIRSQAERVGATITEVEGSHVITISQPQAMTNVIMEHLPGPDPDRGWLAKPPTTRLRHDQEETMTATNESPSTSFGPVMQIEAGVLDVGYVDAGPADGPAVVLLHGWPYDIHSYAEVTPRLTAAGYRVIVPYVRGYGTTRFLSETTVRNGEQAALAFDTVALMDALGIETAIIAGFDWGPRSPDIVAAI